MQREGKTARERERLSGREGKSSKLDQALTRERGGRLAQEIQRERIVFAKLFIAQGK